MGVFRSSFTMRITGFLNAWLLIHFVDGINFPGLRVPLSGPRTSIYSLESCTDVSSSGATSVTPVVLAAGDGRQFTTPGFDGSTGYGKQAKCLWTFAPANGATLTFSCSTFDLTATSAVGDKCTGDFMRVYDLADGNNLDSSGERYCHTTGPAFSYSSQIQVLFNTNSRTTDFELYNNRRTRGREGLHAFHIRLTPHLLRWLHKQSTTGAVCVSCAKSCASPKRNRGR